MARGKVKEGDLEALLRVRVYPSAAGLTVHLSDVTPYKQRERELLQGLQNVMNKTVYFN